MCPAGRTSDSRRRGRGEPCGRPSAAQRARGEQGATDDSNTFVNLIRFNLGSTWKSLSARVPLREVELFEVDGDGRPFGQPRVGLGRAGLDAEREDAGPHRERVVLLVVD